MASQSLYRKWRSQTFGDLVGQEPVIRTLKNALSSGTLAHAYIFTGPRGTGKTSTARLLAKTINCPNSQDGEPCNVCAQCREITVGNSFNVLEIDAASNRGIDSIRELREKVMVPPTTGKYKVYILDEAHMLTTEAFNALLKTLEEPPPHAIFVMATTDVHKMLPTVLSRCQRFDFKRITTRQIAAHLQFVSQQEKVELEQGAAELIARAAAGGMRDALSLLDQAIAYSGQTISLTQIQSMLGVADPRAIQRFILHIADLDSPAGLHLIHELSEAGADLRQINTQVAEYWRAMMLAKAGANIAEILDSTEDEMRDIMQLVKRFGLEELTASARIFAQNELMQKGQGTPQLGLELALLACIELHRQAGAQPAKSTVSVSAPLPPQMRSAPPAPPQRASSSSINGTTQAQGARSTDFHVPPVTKPSSLEKEAPQPAKTVAPPPPVVEARSVELSQSEEVGKFTDNLWDGGPVREDDEPNGDPFFQESGSIAFMPEMEEEVQAAPAAIELEEEVPVATVAVQAESSAPPTLTMLEVKEKWEYVIRRVKTKKGGDGAKVSAFLKGFTIEGIEGTSNLPIVVIKAIAEFHYKALQKDEYSEMIQWAMKIELGVECKLRVLSPSASASKGKSTATASNMLVATPPTPVRLERPRSAPAAPERPAPTSAPQQQVRSPARKPEQASPVSVVSSSPSPQPGVAPAHPKPGIVPESSLARTAVERENSTQTAPAPGQPSGTNGTRQQRIEQHAKSDPVVQEVIRVFKAEIKSIQLK
jgi:DNA polymerase-3 subunit gamma/tau